jgi:hypothetical protein
MDADSVSVYDGDFFYIKRRILVVIEQAPQFINRLALREYHLARRNHQDE